jgi:glutathione S-transferase
MNRILFFTLTVLSPVLVAWFNLPVLAALGLILLLLLWRQALVLAPLTRKPTGPELELETILPSHFAEKVRWCMDRLGVHYVERPWVGVIGAFFRGRTVPALYVQTGRSRSSLGESTDILRYLYGRYAADPNVDTGFLEPTEERLAWEERLDRYGVDLQIWVYHHLVDDPELCKQVWGLDSDRLPTWQRMTGKIFYPVLETFIRRAFNPDKPHTERAVERIDTLLGETESLLADEHQALLGGETSDFIDLTLASLSSVWIQPEAFAAGAYPELRIDPARWPSRMRADMDRWRESFPLTTAHIERLYHEERR